MKYEILYDGEFPALEVALNQGEEFKAESDAMMGMSANFKIDGALDGGFMGGAQRAIAGEHIFLQKVVAQNGPGKVIFAPKQIGSIVDIELDGTYDLYVQKDGYFASTMDIQVNTKMQNLVQGLFSGEGFFIVKISGKGIAFLESYGAIHAVNLEPGEKYIVDNKHLVAWPSYTNYQIKKASDGWISSFTSGEGLVCEFTGPGLILIQTRNPSSFGKWVDTLLPAGRRSSGSSSRGGRGSIGGNLMGNVANTTDSSNLETNILGGVVRGLFNS